MGVKEIVNGVGAGVVILVYLALSVLPVVASVYIAVMVLRCAGVDI